MSFADCISQAPCLSILIHLFVYSCLCKTIVVESAVFEDVQGLSAADVLSSLFIGSSGPAAGSTTFTADGFKYHLLGSSIDEKTVFEVETKGRTLFLKNIRSAVHVQGWESMTPATFEAEGAMIHNAVSTHAKKSYCYIF